MKKIFTFAFSVLFIFILSLHAKAETITINFEDLTFGTPLLSQYEPQGIIFLDESFSSSPAVIANIATSSSSTSNVLQPNSSGAAFYILLADPLLSFSCLKWEPLNSTDNATVYFEFINSEGNSVDTISNGIKGDWVNVLSESFTTDQVITTIKIWGENIPEGKSYYLDELVFSFGTTSNTVPEPFTILLLGFGLMGLAGVRRQFQK